MTNDNKPVILLKISGGCLADKANDSDYNHQQLVFLVEQFKILSSKYQIGVVIGGGNLWRGKTNYLPILNKQSSDYVGMLATVMNGVVLSDYLRGVAGLDSVIYSAIDCPQFSKRINIKELKRDLSVQSIIIFVGGTGMPFVSTDTAAAIRAAQIGAQTILMGKDGVKGVYSCDPKIYPNAVFYPQLTYDQVIEQKLAIMDRAALAICAENNVEIRVFNQATDNAFVAAMQGGIELTKISN